MRAVSVASVFMMACCLGCATLATFGKPDVYNSNWHELTSDHFVLRTDLSTSDAVKALHQMERGYEPVLQSIGPSFIPADAHVQVFTVFLVRSEAEFNQLASEATTYIYLYEGARRFAFSRDLSGPAPVYRMIFLEQVATFLIRSSASEASPWFRVGLPKFLETIDYAIDNPDVMLGLPNSLGAIWGGPKVANMHVRDVLAVKETMKFDAANADRFYRFGRKSWLLTHYLINVKPREFGELNRHLKSGEDGFQAWNAVFPDLNSEKLEGDLAEYIRDGKIPLKILKIPVAPVNYSDRALTPTEVHLTLARIYGLQPKTHLMDARKETAEALKLEPSNPLALEMQRELNEL